MKPKKKIETPLSMKGVRPKHILPSTPQPPKVDTAQVVELIKDNGERVFVMMHSRIDANGCYRISYAPIQEVE
jgi:hypothetical protein